MNERKGTTAISVGIVLMFFISMAISYATALMSKFAEFFPNVNPGSYSYVMSMAFLGVMIGALVAGALVPRVMGYKPASIIGTIIFCVFGLLPVWVHDSFGMVIFFRFMTGFGAGMMSPLANGLVTAFYEGDTRAKLLSVGTAAAQIGNVVTQLGAGVLGDINYWYGWLPPIVGVLTLIAAFALIKEPDKKDVVVKEKTEKGKLNGRVWYCAILELICCTAVMPFLFNFVFFVSEVSDSLTLATSIQATNSVGMVLGGLIYFALFKIFKRRTVGVSMILCALGILIFFLLGKSGVFFMYLGMLLEGIGYGSFLPAMLAIVGVSVEPKLVAFATSLLMIFMNIASFIASPFIQAVGAITGDPIIAPIWVGFGIFVVCAVLLLIVSPYPKDISGMLKAARKGAGDGEAA